MRRKAVVLLLALLSICLFAIPVHAEAPIRIFMNGAISNFTPAPYTDHGYTMLPTAGAAELFGFKTAWSEADRKLTLTRGANTIIFTIDADKALVNGKEVALEAPARLVNGQTFVPLRFLAEITGNIVGWNEKDQLVVISPASSLLSEVINASSKQPDQKMQATMDMSYKLTGAPGQSMAFSMKAQMAGQTYKGNSLINMAMETPQGNQSILMAVIGGKTYMNAGDKWTALPGAQTGSLTQVSGMDTLNLSKEMLSKASISVQGTEVINGVKTVKLAVDVSGADLSNMLKQVLGPVLGDAAPGLQVQVKVEKFAVTYWINPNDMFVYKTDEDAAVTISMSDGTETVNMGITMKVAMTATPSSEPIQWPADLKF